MLALERGLSDPASLASECVLWSAPIFGDWALENACAHGFDILPLTLCAEEQGLEDTAAQICALRKRLSRSGHYRIIQDPAPLTCPRRAQPPGILFQVENTPASERSLDILDVLAAAGVRTLRPFSPERIITSPIVIDTDGKLSAFGREVVRRAQAAGLLLDLSAATYSASIDAMTVAEKPTILSYSHPGGVSTSQLGVTNEQIAACAHSGGLIVVSTSIDRSIFAKQAFRAVDRVCDLVGPDHVGVAGALKPNMALPPARSDLNKQQDAAADDQWHPGMRAIVAVAELMASSGYSDDAVAQIISLNFARVCSDAWTA